ncbi:MAG: 4Fe-4S ferredoxin [Bacteroidales bacterium]|nr:4Fe-4S ferredoxin [Bacteroidales bacterium]
MKRNIIQIDEARCTGCGICATGCHEGALQIIGGKARLVSELYCDGLGACIGDCPMGAISIEEREAEPYDERAVMERIAPKGQATIVAHLKHLKEHGQNALFQEGLNYLKEHDIALNTTALLPQQQHSCNCPGSTSQSFAPITLAMDNRLPMAGTSALSHWPVQLHLINPASPHFAGADLLLAADCTAFAMGGFHPQLLSNRKLCIACPKLDSGHGLYADKLVQLIDTARINTLTVAIMEVPCCEGLLRLAQSAAQRANRKVPIKRVVLSVQGQIIDDNWV